MQIIIHRGTHEIGGSCVEVINGEDRILIDIGTPLINPDKSRFDFDKYSKLSGPELVQQRILPDIKGIYKWDTSGKPIAGMLISHPHIDHYGFFQYLRDNTKYYLGESAEKLIKLTTVFTKQKGDIFKSNYLTSGQSFPINSFTITPYLMDHSAFDAYAFLIEADGRKLFYSGDFRAHGRKQKAFEWFIKNGPDKVDVLLLEGTMLGRTAEKLMTETEIEEKITQVSANAGNIVFFSASSQNIDRLVSFYRASVRTGKLLVIDVYTANVLDELKDKAKIPHPSKEFPNIRVCFPYFLCRRLSREGKANLMYKFKKYKITREEISEKRKNIIMLVRSSMLFDLRKIPNIENAAFIYSMWNGYLNDASMKEFMAFVKSNAMTFHYIHTSGHGDIKTLKRMEKKLNPKEVIPIHTFFPDAYKKISKNTRQLQDGEIYELRGIDNNQSSYTAVGQVDSMLSEFIPSVKGKNPKIYPHDKLSILHKKLSERYKKPSLSKFQGCLLGLAIGDALGAPVEFLTLDKIKQHYGSNGITDFDEWEFRAGSYTDDTQMALATAVGCIRAYHRWENRGICNSTAVIHRCYLEWLKSQDNPFHERGAGNTCITALQSGEMGTIDKKINNSKGCGGVMRTAPIGLAFRLNKVFQEGAECAAITHGHPSGYLSAGFLAQIIAYLVNDRNLIDAIELSVEELTKYKGHQETLDKVKLAMELLNSNIPVEEGIAKIGKGWVGEESLGISLYCALKFPDDYKKGVLAAVNHSGDSDTTGAITGAILGTLLGIESIPPRWVKNVENSEKIKKIANDMLKYIVEGQDIRRHSAEYWEYPPN